MFIRLYRGNGQDHHKGYHNYRNGNGVHYEMKYRMEYKMEYINGL